MSHVKHLMDCVKGCTGGANTGGCGVDVGTLRHETVSHIPLSTEEKIVRFHDLGATAA